MTNSHRPAEMQETESNPREIAAMDQTRRKRLQNRLAQQRYRKRLRKHIEDLEQRAGQRPVSLDNEQQPLEQDNACLMPLSSGTSTTALRSPEKQPLPFVLSTPVQTEDQFSEFVDQSALWDQPWTSFSSDTQLHGDDSNIHTSIGLRPSSTENLINTTEDLFTAAQMHEGPAANNNAAQIANQPQGSVSRERPESQRRSMDSSPSFKQRSSTTPQSKRDLWDTQIAQVSKFVGSLGFQSFDDLVAFYYSGEFQVGSVAHRKQKLSRGRNLPGVLRTLHDSAATWSAWESSGYQNEILQAAEDILVEEIDQAVSPLPISNSGTKDNTSLTVQIQHQITLTAEGSEGTGQGDTKSHLVEEVPNLLAFVTAVLSGESQAVRKAKRKTLLALVAMLSAEQPCQGTSGEQALR